MQNVQVLLHPTDTDTHAAYADSRRVGSVDGKTSSDSRISTCASSCTRARSSRAGREPMLWVPKTTSTHGAFFGDRGAVLLGQAAADRDLHPGALGLDRREVAEVAVELVVGVLPDRAGVEDDDVGLLVGRCRDVARLLQQPGQALGVVDVHLAPVGADLVGADGVDDRAAHDRPRVRGVRT